MDAGKYAGDDFPASDELWSIDLIVFYLYEIQKFMSNVDQITIPFIVEIDIPDSVPVIQFIIDKVLVFRDMADQSIPAEGNAHAVAGKVVGSDLLFWLQLDFGGEKGIAADLICPRTGIIAGFQQQKRIVLKKIQRNRRDTGVQMPAFADIRGGQRIVFDCFVG